MTRTCNLPKTVSATLYVCARRRQSWEPSKETPFVVAVLTYDPTKNPERNTEGWVLLGSRGFSTQVPEVDPVPLEIDALEKLRDQILAKATAEATLVDARIQELKALEYRP